MLFSKETFYLDNEEVDKLRDFLKNEFGLTDIMSIHTDEDNPRMVAITVFKQGS